MADLLLALDIVQRLREPGFVLRTRSSGGWSEAMCFAHARNRFGLRQVPTDEEVAAMLATFFQLYGFIEGSVGVGECDLCKSAQWHTTARSDLLTEKGDG